MQHDKVVARQKRQYEYECMDCGHIWIDNQLQDCPMCGERNDVTLSNYESPPPDKLNRGK